MMKKTTPKNFEDALEQLTEITNTLQNNNLPLEEALAYYQQGQKLVSICQKKLDEVEEKLQVLENDELKELNLDASE